MSSPRTRPWKRASRQITGSFVTTNRAPLLQVTKAGIASVAAWFICLLVLPGAQPIFGTIAALLCVQENISQSLTKGIERFAGVVLGVSVAIAAGLIFGTPSWLFIAAILVALAVGWSLRMTGSSTTQVAISALLMIALGGQQLGYAWERIAETAIGAAIGVLVNAFIVAPIRTSPASKAVTDLVENTANALERISVSLTDRQSPNEMQDLYHQARKLQQEREQVHTLLRSARESLRLNPRGRGYRSLLEDDDELFQHTQNIVTQVIGMSRALYDEYDPDLVEDRTVAGLAAEMGRVAHDLRHIGYGHIPDGHIEVEPPALTEPFRILTPNQQHWVLIGSLMEDLRRIRLRIKELQQLVD